MMNLLMLNYEFPPIGGGGGQAHQSLLTQYATRANLSVDVLTSAAHPGFEVETLAPNVKIHKVGIHKKDLHFWRKTEVLAWLRKAKSHYRRLLRDGNYNLVHAFFGFPTGWLCYRTAARLPYVISLRGSDVPGDNTRLQLEYKILGPYVFKPIWKRATALVACSEGLKARALRFMPTAQIDVIPNGVDLERFHPADTHEEGDLGDTHPEALRLLTVGRLSATKRLPLLMDTVDHLNREGYGVSLTVVGGGALEAELRRTVGQKALRGVVTLVGRADGREMPEIYRRHDVFVSASAQEGMSNAMLEAMASGLPIVTTRCEGVDELITDNGLVVDPPQPTPLARAIGSLADDRATLASMSRAARAQAQGFTWNSIAERYLRIYEQIVT
ncbi:MAG: glycosyltransferase family 4 protein [Planctomycetota bacterium]